MNRNDGSCLFFFLDFGSCLMILACYSSRHLLQCPCSARWESALTMLLGPTVGVPGHTSSFGFPRRPIEDWRIPSFFFLWRGTHCGLRGWRQQTVWSVSTSLNSEFDVPNFFISFSYQGTARMLRKSIEGTGFFRISIHALQYTVLINRSKLTTYGGTQLLQQHLDYWIT